MLLGRRSFGKGSVQELRDRKVADSELALKLTVAQYLTPGDVSIQSVGVAPDVETVPVWVSKEHISFFGRQRFDLLREESLSAHLESDKAEQLRRSPFGPLHYLDQGSLDPDDPDKKTGQQARADRRSAIAPPRDDADEDTDQRTTLLLEDPEIRMARDLVLWAPSSGPRRDPGQDGSVRRAATERRARADHGQPVGTRDRLDPRGQARLGARPAAGGGQERQAGATRSRAATRAP